MTKEEKELLFQEFKERMLEPIEIGILKLDNKVIMPEYANKFDACVDIRSNEDLYIKPNETKLVKTGIKVAIPEGYEIQVRPRSGISLKTRLRIANTPGTIDSGYKGELCVIITNTSTQNREMILRTDEKDNREGTYYIEKNDQIAQLAVVKVEKITFKEVNEDEFMNKVEDRNGGFGSSGTK